MSVVLEVPLPVTALIQRMEAHNIILDREGSEDWQRINLIERELEEMPQQEMPTNHVFTPGLYTRSIFMPAGSLLTSRIHLFQHPFVISLGSVSVWMDAKLGWQFLQAPHIGVTEAGTRRILYAHTDVIWTTTHLNTDNETDPDKLVMQLTYTGGKFKEIGGAKS